MAIDLTAVLRLNSTSFVVGMRNASRSLGTFKSAISETAKQIGLITTAGVAVASGFSSVKKAMDFEEELSTIKALTGASSKEMKQMSDLAMQMGAKTKYSALESAQGIEELLKAGLTPAQVKAGGLEAALNLATAGGLNLADAAEIMSTSLNAFKDDGLKAADAANILAGTANASATDVEDLRYSLAQVSAVAAGVGMSFKDTNTALGLLANNGLKGSDAGTSLKTMLQNLQPSTKAQTEEMRKLGLITKDGANKFFDAHGKLRSLKDIAGLLQNSLKGLTQQQRMAALQTMFGSDAIRAANILYKEGSDGVKKFHQEMGKVTALDVAREKMNNAKGAVETFKGALETLQISVLTPLLPVIKNAANGMANWISKLKPEQIQSFGNKVSSSFQTVLNVVKNVYNFVVQHWGVISNTLIGAAVAVGTFKAAMTGLTIVGTITKLIRAYREATLAATLAEMGLNTTLLLNPFTWVAAGIAALVAVAVLLWRNWDTVKAKTIQLWNKLGPFRNAILSLLGPIRLVIAAGVYLYRNWDKIQATALRVGTNIKNAWSLVSSTTARLFGNMKTAAVNKMQEIADWAKTLPGRIGRGITSKIDDATNGIKKLAQKLVDKFKSMLGIHSPSRVFQDLGGFVVQGLVNGLTSEDLKSLGMSVLKDFGGGVMQGWDSVKAFFSGLLGGGFSGGGNVSSWLTAALGLTGTPLSWLPGLLKLVQAESGGNPSAVNKATVLGQHATGLLQMLPSTFRAYMLGGHGNILNPIDNAAAAIRYIKSRYGSVYNTPLFRGGPYKGYNGGLDRVPYDGFIGRLHKDEMILTRGEADKYRKGQSGGNTYQFGNIIIQGGPTDRDTARRLLEVIVKEIEMAGGAGA